MNDNQYLTLNELLARIDEPYQKVCKRILNEDAELMLSARGSTHNHQAWTGGYLDHVREIMNVAVAFYETLNVRRPLPFTLSDALFVLFVHDLEKPWAFEEVDGVWKRTKLFQSKDDAHNFRINKITKYGLNLPDYLERAIFFVEGEIKHYSSTQRAMSPLAAFCHLCDVTSARIWYDYPVEQNDPWISAGRLGGQ